MSIIIAMRLTACSIVDTGNIYINSYIVAKCFAVLQTWGLVLSRHTVVCQQPRKLCSTQACYLCKPPIAPFQPIVV